MIGQEHDHIPPSLSTHNHLNYIKYTQQKVKVVEIDALACLHAHTRQWDHTALSYQSRMPSVAHTR